MQSPVKAIFFDLGGTLFSYGGRQGGGISHVLKSKGVNAAPEEIGQAWQMAAARAGEHYGRQRYFLHKDLFRDTLTHFLAEFDQQADDEFFTEFHLKQRDGMVEHLPIRDDCRSTLQALRERGLYLSVVSNIDDDYLYPLLDKHDLVTLFDHCTSSEEARSCKPDPEIYHYAVKKSGLTIDDVLFVGDSLHHDVAGAHKVGMRSARIVDEGVVTPLTHGLEVIAEPTFEISSLSDLIGVIESVNQS